jgi:hypothetical protein
MTEPPMAWNSSKWRAVLLDFLERAGWSAGQVFFATVVAGSTQSAAIGLPWKTASLLALGAAVSSVVLTAVQYLGRFTNLSFWPDLLVRLGKTFLGSLGASFAAADVFDVTRFHWTAALNVAFLATLSALGKGLLARGAAVLPAEITGVHPHPTADGAKPAGGDQVAVGRVPQQMVRDLSSPSTLPTNTYRSAVGR